MTQIEKFYRLVRNIAKFEGGVSYYYYNGKFHGIEIDNCYFLSLNYNIPGNSISIYNYEELETEYQCDKNDLEDLDKMIEFIRNYFPGEEKELLEGIEWVWI